MICLSELISWYNHAPSEMNTRIVIDASDFRIIFGTAYMLESSPSTQKYTVPWKCNATRWTSVTFIFCVSFEDCKRERQRFFKAWSRNTIQKFTALKCNLMTWRSHTKLKNLSLASLFTTNNWPLTLLCDNDVRLLTFMQTKLVIFARHLVLFLRQPYNF